MTGRIEEIPSLTVILEHAFAILHLVLCVFSRIPRRRDRASTMAMTLLDEPAHVLEHHDHGRHFIMHHISRLQYKITTFGYKMHRMLETGVVGAVWSTAIHATLYEHKLVVTDFSHFKRCSSYCRCVYPEVKDYWVPY